jgi:hypothetical protein
MSYQEELKRHLIDYKRRHLDVSQPGVFDYRGRKMEYEHILPFANSSKSLLEEAEPTASAFLTANRDKRHKYFHHLNSSQAFAFNLFFPYFCGGPEAASALLRALGRESVFGEWEPEAVPDPNEGSNIDALWTTKDGVRTFCEVKLSETDFGKAVDNAPHRVKLEEIYRHALVAHLEPGRLEALPFFEAYQFNRNVWHMVRGDHNRLTFLLPRANVALWSQLQRLLSGVLARTRERISVVAIEDVLAKLSVDDRCPEKLREYANKLKQKYVI